MVRLIFEKAVDKMLKQGGFNSLNGAINIELDLEKAVEKR